MATRDQELLTLLRGAVTLDLEIREIMVQHLLKRIKTIRTLGLAGDVLQDAVMDIFDKNAKVINGSGLCSNETAKWVLDNVMPFM